MAKIVKTYEKHMKILEKKINQTTLKNICFRDFLKNVALRARHLIRLTPSYG